jgi:hypothetical protein
MIPPPRSDAYASNLPSRESAGYAVKPESEVTRVNSTACSNDSDLSVANCRSRRKDA